MYLSAIRLIVFLIDILRDSNPSPEDCAIFSIGCIDIIGFFLSRYEISSSMSLSHSRYFSASSRVLNFPKCSPFFEKYEEALEGSIDCPNFVISGTMINIPDSSPTPSIIIGSTRAKSPFCFSMGSRLSMSRLPGINGFTGGLSPYDGALAISFNFSLLGENGCSNGSVLIIRSFSDDVSEKT